MVKIVVKKEGATQTCGKCATDLICRLKDYGGNFAPTLQWQNYDGTPHFKTSDGKNYACNVPDEEETAQTRIPTEVPSVATTPGNVPPVSISPNPISPIDIIIEETLESINLRVLRIEEMVEAIFRYTVNEQMKKK